MLSPLFLFVLMHETMYCMYIFESKHICKWGPYYIDSSSHSISFLGVLFRWERKWLLVTGVQYIHGYYTASEMNMMKVTNSVLKWITSKRSLGPHDTNEWIHYWSNTYSVWLWVITPLTCNHRKHCSQKVKK